jgi:recombination protein RecA
MKGSDSRLEVVRLSSGIPQLDNILDGGFAYRRNVMCVGPESTGKTLIAQYAAASAQKAGKRVLLVDAEMSFVRDWWALSGVDTDELFISQPPTGEIAVDIIISFLQQDPEVGLIILDSIAALSPTAVLEKRSGERTVASLATLVTNLYTRLLPANKGSIFFAINQLRDNMDGYDDVYPGGRRLRHDNHLILRIRRKEFIMEGKERIGQVIEVLAKKNKVGQPYGECEIALRFRDQIDFYTSYIEEAIERAVLENAGPYYYWHRGQENSQKWLGKNALREFFMMDYDKFEQLKVETAARV